MKLSDVEKKEMLEDGNNEKRKENFRKIKYLSPKMSFEEYLSMLEQLNSINSRKMQKRIVNYRNVKL